ncbi:MAG: TonB-dependent receptor plug domain-containing protein [Bacteroidota bacterium]
MKRTRLRFQIINHWIISFILLLSICSSNAQQSNIPLKIVLDSLENRYDVVFSYADEHIEDKIAELPNQALNLEECLRQLSETTHLSFERLNERYIAVKPTSVLFCGFLFDKASNDPIEFAIISDSKKDRFETSNQNGYFNWSGYAEGGVLSISHVAYRESTISITMRNSCDTIYLESKISELEVVYVSNYLVVGMDKKPNGAFELNTRELQVLPGLSEPDVLYTLQVLPGIQSPYESVSDINVRGGNNDQNLILWDGIRMFQSGHFYGLITAFNPYFTDRVTLTKNGSNPEFGEGVSGTLDIHSTDKVERKFSGGAGLNWLSGDLFLNVPITSSLSMSLSGRRSIADLIQTPTYANYYDRAFLNTEVGSSTTHNDEEFKFYDLSSKINFHPGEKDKFSLSFIRIYNDLAYQEDGDLNGSVSSRVSGLTQASLGGSLNYSRIWNDRWSSNISGYLSSYQLSSLNNDISNNQRLIQENEVLDFRVQIDADFQINDRLKWKNGFQYEETGVVNLEDINNPFFRRRIKSVLSRYIGSSEMSFNSSQGKTNWMLGIRANYYDQYSRFIIEPRLSFRQEIIPAISLEIQGELKNQTMSQVIDLQTDFLGVEKRRWVLANGNDIPIIQSKQVSSGLHYHENKLLISAEAYYKFVDGIITSGQGLQNQYEFIRATGSYETYGGEFLVSKQFDRFSLWSGYALSWNYYSFPDLADPDFPNNLDVRHNLNLGSSYQTDHFEISAGIYWHSGAPYTSYDPIVPIVNSEIQYQVPNSDRLASYLRLDLSGKYLFKIGEHVNAQIGFSLWNLTNYQNLLRTYFKINDQGHILQIKQNGLSFTPNAMFRVAF